MKSFSSKISIVLLLSSIVLLPGCWLKDKLGLNKNEAVVESVGTGQVLATINGKPLLTVDEFEKQFKNLIEKHPYGAMLAQMEGLDKKFFEGLVAQKVITQYVKDNKIDQSAEYKQQLDSLIQMLNMQFFQKEHAPKVSDAEMREFYEKNKETMPEAILSRGGVTANGVSFTNEADAKAFVEKAKGNGASKSASLEKFAKEANIGDKFRDFKMVNATSPVEPVLREKISEIKKFPTIEIIKVADNNYYVVQALSKEEPKYRNFDEVKSALEQRLAAKKQEEVLEKAIEQLKKDYNVVVHEDFFNKKAEKKDVENGEQLESVMPSQEEARGHQPATSTKAA